MTSTVTKSAISIRDVLASIPKPEQRRQGWFDIVGAAGSAGAGAAAPTITSYGVAPMRHELWVIGDYKTFYFHIPHEYATGTKIYPHVHWSAMTAAPNTAHTVQFDCTYQVGKSFSQSAFTSETTISLLDSPTGFAFNEIVEASDAQAINLGTGLDTDSIIYITVKRVTPASGTSYTGNVIVSFVDLHTESDMVLTNEKAAPFTKSNIWY
jgi:hypothetical protein